MVITGDVYVYLVINISLFPGPSLLLIQDAPNKIKDAGPHFFGDVRPVFDQ